MGKRGTTTTGWFDAFILWLDTNGLISLSQPRNSYFVNAAIPSPGSPNDIIAPFWADIRVDASASMHSAVTGTAPNRALTIEWRNVYISHDPNLTRFSFEARLDPLSSWR